jgi:hypothetical protein
MKTMEACEIILAMMKKAVLQSDLINIDETPVRVLKEPGRIKSYMWVFKGTSRGRPVLLYHYDPSRSGDVAASFLNGYKGIVQTDGYSGYGFLDQKKDILHVGCVDCHFRIPTKCHNLLPKSGLFSENLRMDLIHFLVGFVKCRSALKNRW